MLGCLKVAGCKKASYSSSGWKRVGKCDFVLSGKDWSATRRLPRWPLHCPEATNLCTEATSHAGPNLEQHSLPLISDDWLGFWTEQLVNDFQRRAGVKHEPRCLQGLCYRGMCHE